MSLGTVESQGGDSCQFCSTDQGLFTSVLFAAEYRKEGTGVPSLNKGGFGIYSMNKTGSQQKLSVTRINAAS